ncbi:hypothetical protein [Vibrio sp. OPT20]|uniref:hypothetical protein n=1 Tax=Vibrio sp. OPT20 TaxID=2778642 RepID=UPI00187F1747|nr:hypothetical protein [Vibrio sp. OPT20]MBE8564185.1 hypothetical protein [Vibrio sp. OPT20]
MYSTRLVDIDFSYDTYQEGLERYIRCTWALHMYRHHVFGTKLSDMFMKKANRINESLGITVVTIDLNTYRNNFRSSEELIKYLEENEYPKWIWFYGIEALKDSNFAGWLRNRLTVRSIENLRVIFVAQSRADYREVFCDRGTPFYQSTMLLQTDIEQN